MEQVFAELHRERPAGLRYAAFRQVLTISAGGVARIDMFHDLSLFPSFGLPDRDTECLPNRG